MKIGVIQLTSTLDYKENLKKIDQFMEVAVVDKATAVFLPECFYSMSDGKNPTPYLVEGENEHYQNIKNLAKKHGIYLLAGSVATKVDGKIVNRVFNFNPKGEEIGRYDKIHLFSCNLQRDGEVKKISEGDIYTPGDKERVIEVDGRKIGLGVCFDLRFSDMSLNYRKKGAEILTFSSAFTVPTGKAHWHTLLRSRAIENQCFVIAPAQWGRNNDRISTYGHSLVVDPWGEILVDAREGEKIVFVDLDFNRIQEVRDSVIMY